MQRVKSFDSTGVAPSGVLYSGDLNLIEDAAAGLSDFTQTIELGSLAIGEAGLQLLHYGSLEARLSGALRTDGILRGLGGVLPAQLTTAQRDALPPGSRPYGLVIVNSTTNQYEFNAGTDVSPVWRTVGLDPSGSQIFTGSLSKIGFTGEQADNFVITMRRAGDTNDRFRIREDGRMEWGNGTAPTDTALYRDVAGRLKVENDLMLAGTHLYFENLAYSFISGDSASIKTMVGQDFQVLSQDGTEVFAIINKQSIRLGDGRFAVRGDFPNLYVLFGTATVPGYGLHSYSLPVTFSQPPWVGVIAIDNTLAIEGFEPPNQTFVDHFTMFSVGTGLFRYIAVGPVLTMPFA